MARNNTFNYKTQKVSYKGLTIETWRETDHSWSGRIIEGGFNDGHNMSTREGILAEMKLMVDKAQEVKCSA